jgi:hypothetical protein
MVIMPQKNDLPEDRGCPSFAMLSLPWHHNQCRNEHVVDFAMESDPVCGNSFAIGEQISRRPVLNF